VIVAGIGLALSAAVANAFAVVFQAAEARHSSICQAARFSLLLELARRPQWLFGTGLLLVVWPLQIAALTFAPITVVQPLMSVSQLALLGIARVRLREQVSRTEVMGVLSIVVGVTSIVVASPHHAILHPQVVRLAIPLAVVGAGALTGFAIGRLRSVALPLVVGAGFGYAWADFANKLLSNALASGEGPLAAGWLMATIAIGSLAFLSENTALQRRAAVTVSPVVGAVQSPLPVLMALASGIERWSAGAQHVVALLAGLGLVATGASVLGRSSAVARLTVGHGQTAQRSMPAPEASPS
jgi:hypothetical protein